MANPNQYNAELNSYSTGATGGTGYALLFDANQIHVYNDKLIPVYLSLGSTALALTGHRTCAGESLVVRDILVRTFSVSMGATTSTAGQVRVLAAGI